ncbi:E3 ubiquitin-protein ligase SHPRH [Fistulifera solaris]|uniref:E3 ubiquitin-protein ligase SHPRH n=1 Tax=Fistulifera solaris TaxID=1519565 RepID=A0A1Z5JRD4_FISSO|nr:E3 ubiquitin-protein ligase SHPRH [Fistulifera solaris]|eukprot:GAX16412.1 E3 ubiquitin-protein ligase SHPRH [Fistulifera solaris]
MGRRKWVPQKKQVATDEWSGRKALPQHSLEWILAEEVLVPDRTEIVEELAQLVDTDEEMEQTPRNIKYRKKKKKSRRNQKTVHFSTPLSVIIPNVELEIVSLDSNSDEPLLLQYNGVVGTEETDHEHHDFFLIESTRDIGVMFPCDSKGRRVSITTPHGIRVVLSLLCPQATRIQQEVFQRAVSQDRTLQIILVQRADQSWRLQLYLTETAFRLCHPSFVPVRTNVMAWRSKKLQPVMDLRIILETLFAAPPVSENLLLPSAKQVYSVTDNVQLVAAMQHEAQQLPMCIPGLVPTLRPYQEHAVRWMLQRESGTGVAGEEWKLAWRVLNADIPSLTEWEGANDVLLYNPFMGWLAKAVNEARSMCVPPISDTRGGILAESMGLGKTVEVLACILANPRPVEECSRTINQMPFVKRRLVFDDDASGEVDLSVLKTLDDEEDNKVNDSNKKQKVGVVEDLAEFAEAEESDVDSVKDESAAVCVSAQNASEEQVEEAKVNFQVVTPDVSRKPFAIEERWLDDDNVGSCICSKLVCFSTARSGLAKSQPIVICKSCEEPMHWFCASFNTVHEMRSKTKAVHLRQRYTNLTIECGLCEDQLCPCCVFSKKRKLKSAATLIVTPAAILNQWTREIKRHTLRADKTQMNILIYEGINRVTKMQGARKLDESIKLLHPKVLATADIVLMTFDALMGDLGHSDDNKFIASCEEESMFSSQCSLRRRKRYRVVPSPLQSIEWWRVCLDEAQRVETPTAASARMALKLDAVHRWCVSGTPIGRGKLEDLFGLLLFLRVEPFCHPAWFKKCFGPSSPQSIIGCRIASLLRHVFWRSTKALPCVREQMGVPEQAETKTILNFSSVEKYFYDRQLEETVALVGDVTERTKTGKKRKVVQIQVLTERLHKLRAACCHPQVGSSGLAHGTKRRWASPSNHESERGLASRVMTMSQILHRFIDDARQKCEESQRLVILHTNGMGAIARLKVEAKKRGIEVRVSDAELLRESCRLYEESLALGEANAVPTLTTGEVLLTGSIGFREPQRVIKSGSFVADWECSSHSGEVWTRIDFEGARKIIQMTVRSIACVPPAVSNERNQHFTIKCLHAREIMLQVSSAAVGGEFVDVASIILPFSEAPAATHWQTISNFRTNKSKSWRVVIKSFYNDGRDSFTSVDTNTFGVYAGLEIQLYEADIANDPLQRLHCLHNASLSLQLLLDANNDQDAVDLIEEKIKKMKAEEEKIESLYLDVLRSIHTECHRKLSEENKERERLEIELRVMHTSSRNKPIKDCWDDNWWDDFLVLLRLHGSENEQKAFCEKVVQDMDGYLRNTVDTTNSDGIIAFPEFGDVNGLRVAINSRIERIRDGIGGKNNRTSRRAQEALVEDGLHNVLTNKVLRFRCPAGGHKQCMHSILNLSASPDEEERFENSHCRVCKADWLQMGPKCQHCKIGENLEELAPDRVTLLLMTSLHAILKGPFGVSFFKKANVADAGISERARLFWEVMEAERRERAAAWRMWRTHLDLLNDLDELGQCKSSMRILYDNEDVTTLSEEQLNAVVVPFDVHTRYHDHAAKAAMFMGDLRRAKDTLRFLRNQAVEEATKQEDNPKDDDQSDRCVLCLSGFGSERAVLRCGHSYHLSPCLEDLKARSRLIACPMRCRIRTDPSEVMIATAKRNDDGSRCRRNVKGSWGTKVTRLVADVLDIRDKGEKGVIFSQWEDMLDIVQGALTENGVLLARATSMRHIGSRSETFLRDRACTVLLLNVKNGAEGLTLLEATHVFMVEPLLNCGLDSQAINRVHRIGQHKKTYVHRYLMADTIEMKIDQLRVEHLDEEEQLEDSIYESKGTMLIRAGGIDGGFRSEQELLSVLQP